MINAVILAIGKEERLLPLTEKIPKPLLLVCHFLKEAKVENITKVVEFLHKKFLHL